MSIDDIQQLHNEIKKLAEDSKTAVEIAQRAAEVAYKASLDNVTLGKELKNSIAELQKSITPITKVYAIFDGTGVLLQWFFRWIIIPISVVIGIILSWKTLVAK